MEGVFVGPLSAQNIMFIISFRMFANGSIEISTENGFETFNFDEICVAFQNTATNGRQLSKEAAENGGTLYRKNNSRIFSERFIYCPKTKDEVALDTLYTVAYPICCTISNFFLLLTFMAYVLQHELRKMTTKSASFNFGGM